MSFSRLRFALIALMLVVPVSLGACSGLRPVYGPASAVERIEIAYAQPRDRLGQIIIQALKVRLGSSTHPGAPRLTVTASSSTRALTSTGVTKPFTQREVTVTARYTLSSPAGRIATGSRSASANYATSGQVLADEAALKDARERAGVAVAEAIRLSILAALTNPVPILSPDDEEAAELTAATGAYPEMALRPE